MNTHKTYTLKTTAEFKRLIAPMSKTALITYKRMLLKDGCTDPIVVWNNIILDGLERYQICTEHKIPYYIQRKKFQSKEAAIQWVCNLQLKREDLPEDYRKYLIGKIYLSQQIINGRGSLTPQKRTKVRLALEEEHALSTSTLYRYGCFATAIDEIATIDESLINILLSDRLTISHNTVVELSKLTATDLKRINHLFQRPNDFSLGTNEIRLELQRKRQAAAKKRRPVTKPEPDIPAQIKQMPQFDPDAEVSSLSLTIPSWISSITRAFGATDLNLITPSATMRIKDQLTQLMNTATEYLNLITENENE